MSSVAEIQAAMESLPASDRLALFRWLEQSDAVRAERLAALRAMIAEDDRDLAEGRYSVLESDDDFRTLATELKQGFRRDLGRSA